MSRWRHILLASPPSLSACPKPTAEKKHDPSPTDNEIKNGNIISCAGLLSAYALRSRGKAAAKINAQRGTKASPLRNSHCANATCFCRLAHLGIASQWSCSSPTAPEILPPHCRFVLRAWPEMEEPLLEVG
jgi:hypothetical protein